MKLLTRSIIYLSISILAIIGIWSVFFYINMEKEIKSSIDEGLRNYKRLIIQNAHKDPSILHKTYFDESFFTIQKIDKKTGLTFVNQYLDTILYMQDFYDPTPELEEVRMLITAFEFDEEYYMLKVANAMVDKEDMVAAFFKNTIWLYLSLIIAILIINNIVLKRLWKPFYDLLFQIKEYRLDSTQKLPKVQTRTKEFTDLNNTINTLLVDSKVVYEQQKQFIGNASHELQTPLAISINKMELLLEDKNLSQEQATTITEIYDISQRMVRLNKSLLLLSKIENKQFLKNQEVSLLEVTQNSIEELEDFAAFKKIEILIKKSSTTLLSIDPTLAYILISNLIRNAIFHNIENGVVHITVDKNSFKICNTGVEHALDKDKIFTQFYKSHKNSKGTGLGLAIVKAITDLYGYLISYEFTDKHHCIKIQFDTTHSSQM